MAQPSPLIFMYFHAVLFGNWHEIWSKQHNRKVRSLYTGERHQLDPSCTPSLVWGTCAGGSFLFSWL